MIADIDASDWIADLTDIAMFDLQPGLVMLRLLDGDAIGLRAIGELAYPVGARVLPYREGPATVFGKTPFAPHPG